MKKIFLNVMIAFAIITFASSCLKNGDSTSSPTQGALLVANLSPDATLINMTLNSEAYVTNFSYGAYTPYYLQTAGSYSVGVYSTSSSTTPIFSNTLTIDPNKFYSYFVIDTLATLKYAFMEDKIVTPSSDSVYVRYLNFCPNGGVIHFRDSATHTIISSSRTFNDQVIQTSYTSFTRALPAIRTLQLVSSDSTVLVSKPDTLLGGHIYTIIARGLLNGTDTKAIGIGRIQNY